MAGGGSKRAERLHRQRFSWQTAAVIVFVLVAVFNQFRICWETWGSDLAGFDDPAHYTTGVMVYEYVRHALFSGPMQFARSFYLRFPKVAIGHWPPIYYVVQAAWYSAFGPSISAARSLSGFICFVTAFVLFVRVRGLHNTSIGALCAACFLILPAVQANSWLVMSDLLVALLMFLAAMSFSDYLESEDSRRLAWFIFWSSLAILTKGSAWSLGIFAILAPLFSRRFSCFRNKWFWISGPAIVLVSAPFFWWTQSHRIGYPSGPGDLARSTLGFATRLAIISPFGGFLPLLVFLVAFAGSAVLISKPSSTSEAAAVALVVSQLVFLLIFPLTEERRYYIPSAVAVMMVFARGLTFSGRKLVPYALAGACFAVSGFATVSRVDGYRAVVDSIPYALEPTAILLGSDAPGEGALVAERLEHDRARSGIMLRGSKVLAKSEWSGDGYQPIFRDPKEVLNYIESIPVRYVVIDRASQRSLHERLLEIAVRSASGIFVLKKAFPIHGSRNGNVLVFENIHAAGRPPNIQIQ